MGNDKFFYKTYTDYANCLRSRYLYNVHICCINHAMMWINFDKDLLN